MKLIVYISFLAIWSALPLSKYKPEPISFEMGNIEWFFPATAGDATKMHNLDYKPPGYYYKEYPSDMEVILDYHNLNGDFDNEYQSKETLFPRKVHSYIFRFSNNLETYDSLRLNIEKKFNKKFVLTKGMKDPEIISHAFNASSIEKEFTWDFLTVNKDLTVCIAKGRKKIVVRYMYDLSPGLMGIYMGNFIE